MKKILFIVGSLRKDSFNKQAARYAASLLDGKAEVSFLDYADVPLMNEDIEFPTPAAVARVRKEVTEADGLWFFTPEYNKMIPGLLKNLLDWLSRPLAAGEKTTAMQGKKATIAGVGYRRAAVGSRNSLSELLDFLGARVANPSTGISAQFDTDGKFMLSETQKLQLKEQAEGFVGYI